MTLCSYARNGELVFVCPDVYAVDCDSAGCKYEVHAFDIVQLLSPADLISQSCT